MALAQTTLSGPCAVNDTAIRVLSLTGLAVGQTILVDHEVMAQVGANQGPLVPVRRGLDGTVQAAHATGALLVTGLPSDFPAPGPGQTTTYGPSAPDGMQAGWTYATYSVAGAIPPTPGVHVINGAAAIAMTLAAPSLAQEGATLTVVSKNLHANTLAGSPAFLGAAGGTGTFAATGGSVQLKAVSGKWAVVAGAGVTFA